MYGTGTWGLELSVWEMSAPKLTNCFIMYYLQELQSLVKLSHENIAGYITMSSIQIDDKININLLQEYVSGTYT